MADVSLVNVVGHLDFQRELRLSAVAELLSQSKEVQKVKFEPGENNWLQSWFTSPQNDASTYVSFYRSGTAIVTGCDSIEEFNSVSERVIEAMKPAIQEEVIRSIRNIVTTSELNEPVDLATLGVELGFESIEYEPEQFPALIYRDDIHDCVFLVFASGKLVCTGLDDLDDAQTAVDAFVEKLAS